MEWLNYIAWFFGGAFLTNAIPHFTNGVSDRAFQSIFSRPPGVGLSSSSLNIVWGFMNLVVAWLLLARVGTFDVRVPLHALALGFGVLLMGLALARTFGRFHGGNDPQRSE
ncbi:MAG: hypothetical protein ABL879_11470 [Devosia sp.]